MVSGSYRTRVSVSLLIKVRLGSDIPSDLNALSYVAEYQENLRIVQIMLHGIDIPMKDDLSIETTAPSRRGLEVDQAIVSSKRDPATTLRLSLPVSVYPEQSLPFTLSDLQLEAKLAAPPSTTPVSLASLNTVVPHALSASELREVRLEGLCCTSCDREVADLSFATIFKDLPSEHWAEMMDVWMCHDDAAFTSQLASRTKDGFWPSKGVVLVGGSYLLVDGGQAKKHQLHAEGSQVSLIFCHLSSSPGYKKVITTHPLVVLRTTPLVESPMAAKLLQASLLLGAMLRSRRRTGGPPLLIDTTARD